jgi:molybdopterin-dependent oxidoreductase alpha subunit
MGICEKPPSEFLERLGNEFGFEPPQEHGLNTVGAIRALAEGRAKVFVALGGNFVAATPDTHYTANAVRSCRLTVQISTKLNRSHVVVGEEALILPCLGRTERDVQGDRPQFVTVENSMRVVHRSQGHLPPASEQLRSEPAIIAGLAETVLKGRTKVPWKALARDYDRIREHISHVVRGFESFNRAVRDPHGFVLQSGACSRSFETPSGRAHFSVHPLPRQTLEPGQYLMTTIRSHDQFNTTIYGFDDRYRGVRGNRRVVFLHPMDMAEAGLEENQLVDLASHFQGETRTAAGFRAIPFDLPRRCAATYFPEANPLVPIGSIADRSHTPTYKSIVITISASG